MLSLIYYKLILGAFFFLELIFNYREMMRNNCMIKIKFQHRVIDEWLSRWVSGKESTYNTGDTGLIPGLGRCPGEENGNPLQYSCLENPIDKIPWTGGLPSMRSQRVGHDLTITIIDKQNCHLLLLIWPSYSNQNLYIKHYFLKMYWRFLLKYNCFIKGKLMTKMLTISVLSQFRLISTITKCP